MTDAASPNPVAIGAAIKAIVADPARLGLTWELRPGTVLNPSPLTVVYDGDTTALTMTNLLGVPLGIGSRVYAIAVPPSGNFVVGYAGSASLATISTGVLNGFTGSTTSNFPASVNTPGPIVVTINKKFASTNLYVQTAGTWFATVASTGVIFNVRIVGVSTVSVNLALLGIVNSALNSHTPFAGSATIPNLGAGKLVCTLQYARLSGTGTVNINSDDFQGMTVSEVWPS